MGRKYILLLIILCVFLIALVFTSDLVSAKPSKDSKDDNKGKKEILVKDKSGNVQKASIESETSDGKIRQKIKLEKSKIEAKTELEVEVEDGEFKVRLSNGQLKDIKIMPDMIATKALVELGTEAF